MSWVYADRWWDDPTLKWTSSQQSSWNSWNIGTPSQQKKNETTDNAVNTLAKWLNSLFQILSIIAVPAIVMASWLMSPDWTSGDMFNLRDTMYQLWVTVSNVIYFVYAVLLIIIAIGTILWNEKFWYKAMLPRLALGIIMVPFTWWFVQWTISLATVITASVITIPADIVNLEDNSYAKSLMIPKKWVITADSTEIDKATRKNIEQCEWQGNSNCISFMEAYESVWWIYGSLLYYAQWVFQISKIQKASFDIDWLKSLWQLANELIIWALFFIVFWILVIALVFMLLMRAIKLWMYAIFSPLFTIHFVLGKDTLWEKMWDFNLKEFIGLCFVPAVVGITLSFWLVVISAIKWVKPSENIGCTEQNCKVTLFWVSDNYIETKLISTDDWKSQQTITTVKMWELETVFNGKAYPTDASGWNTAQNISKWLNVLGPLFGTIVIDIIALIFIWAAFMAAKWTSKAVAWAIKPFEDLWASVWRLGASLPKYAPLPIPGWSLSGANKLVWMWENALSYQSNKRLEDNKIYKFLKDKSGDTTDAASRSNVQQAVLWKDLKKLIESLRGQDWANSVRYIDDILKNKENALSTIKDQRYDIDRTLRKRAEELLNQKSMTDPEKYELMAILRWAKSSDSERIRTQQWARQFIDEQAKKEKTWATAETPISQNTTINITAWTPSDRAIQEIKEKRNNWTITEADLKTELEWIYKDNNKIINEIIDWLNKKGGGFTFKSWE